MARMLPLGRLALALVAAQTLACQVAAPRVEPPDTRKADVTKASAKPSSAASSSPAAGPASAAPSPAASASAAASVGPTPAAALLVRPTGEVTVLAGTVAVDASYLVAHGGGSILSHNGGQVVAAGAGLIGADAASLVAAGGGNLVAAGGGNLVAAGGGNLVAAGGGNVISPNGGAVVGSNGSRFALAQASASPSASASPAASSSPAAAPSPALELGAVLPAAGMRVEVRDLRTGKPVALGVDAQGAPVHAVYTSATGGFEVYVPKELASNLRVVARVPGLDDPRLAYEVFATPGGGPAAIDEDTALVYGYLAASWRGRMKGLMTELAAQPPRTDEAVLRKLYGRGGTAAFQAALALLKPLVAELRAGMKTHQVDTPEELAAASARAADTVLARMDHANLVASQAPMYVAYLAGEEKAFAVFIAAVKQVRARAAEQMRAAGPGGQAAFLAAAPFAAAGDRITRPADVPAYIVAEAFTDEQDIQAGAAVAYLRALGFDQAAALRLQGRLWAANAAAGEHLGLILATDAAVRADLIAALAAPAP